MSWKFVRRWGWLILGGGLMILWFNNSMPGRLFGLVLCFLAFGSAWFHGTLTETGQTVDIAGVYVSLLVLIGYAILEVRHWPDHDTRAWIMMIVLVAIGVVTAIVRTELFLFNSDVFVPILVVILVVWMVIAIFHGGLVRPWTAIVAVSTGLAAVLFKFTDGTDNGPLANHKGVYADCLYEGSIVQGHAIWHVLSAIMFVAMFEYFRALRNRSKSSLPWRNQRAGR